MIPQCLVLQVIDPRTDPQVKESNRQELEQLVFTLGGEVVDWVVQQRFHPHSATYIGPGKLDSLTQIIIDKQITHLIINDQISAGQLFRIEKTFWELDSPPQIWDRVDLILAIFDLHAATTAAKLQIKLARIQHEGPRMMGLGKDRLSRQGGGIGTRGMGETNLEKEKRLQRDQIRQLKKDLASLDTQKQLHLTQRADQGMGPVALVGYTSAGKTTLFNKLTGKQKVVSQKLFTTLDTVVGKMKLDYGQPPIIISDTIGFIQNLPPSLIAAFKSTLLESLQAKIILHVVDASDKAYFQKIQVVTQILTELKVTQPVWLVFNQIDKLSLPQLESLKQSITVFGPDQISHFISSLTGAGCDQLKSRLSTALSKQD